MNANGVASSGDKSSLRSKLRASRSTGQSKASGHSEEVERHDLGSHCLRSVRRGHHVFWAHTRDSFKSACALVALGAISTALVLEVNDNMQISHAIGRVIVEFYEVGGAVFLLIVAWATISVNIRRNRK